MIHISIRPRNDSQDSLKALEEAWAYYAPTDSETEERRPDERAPLTRPEAA